MYTTEPMNTNNNFVVKNLNSAGATQPTDTDRAVFRSEATLDTAVATVHAAKDRPYLTQNDKVFAARYTIGVFNPL
jgi:hypothetical protein